MSWLMLLGLPISSRSFCKVSCILLRFSATLESRHENTCDSISTTLVQQGQSDGWPYYFEFCLLMFTEPRVKLQVAAAELFATWKFVRVLPNASQST